MGYIVGKKPTYQVVDPAEAVAAYLNGNVGVYTINLELAEVSYLGTLELAEIVDRMEDNSTLFVMLIERRTKVQEAEQDVICNLGLPE